MWVRIMTAFEYMVFVRYREGGPSKSRERKIAVEFWSRSMRSQRLSMMRWYTQPSCTVSKSERGSGIPYIAHLMSVSSRVLSAGGTALEMRFVPKMSTFQVRRPFRISQVPDHLHEGGSRHQRGAGRAIGREPVGSFRHVVEDALEAGPIPGNRCRTRKPATRSRGFSTNRSSARTLVPQ
jgi:hypothetical protein